MRRRLILALAALAIAAPSVGGRALAAEHAKEGEEGKSNSQDVDIAIVGLPVIMQGRLINYIFTSVKVVLAPSANLSAIRTKEPYFRDALVRAAHITPFTVAGDPNKIDEVALRRTMLAETRRIAGAKNVVDVKVTSQQAKSIVRTPLK